MSKVRGLEHFSNYFKAHEDDYVIIGGSVAEVMLNNNDLSFRATKDDLLLVLKNAFELTV